ncbi:HvfC/BufC N-terminal domain-containing protein [Chitinibacteraceae bacterium HSL-7]
MLREWQQQLQNSILDARDAIELPLHAGGSPRHTQLSVYVDAYRLRLIEALRTNHPVLHQLLGDDDFDALALGYLAAYPSQHPSIRWFGADLARFLAHTEPFAAVPAMAELARFEWALRHAIDAANAAVLQLGHLAALNPADWPVLPLVLQPSVTLMLLDWNAPQIWRALDAGDAPPPPEQAPACWLVWRGEDLVIQWRSASASEAAVLPMLQAGTTFGGVCEALAARTDVADAALEAAGLLKSWVEGGVLAR